MIESYYRNGTILSTKEESLVIGHGKRVWSSSPEAHELPSFYFPDFFLRDDAPWFQHENVEEITIKYLHKRLLSEKYEQNIHWKMKGENVYSHAFSHLMSDFRSGILRKAVPYLFYTSQDPICSSQSLLNLLEHSMKHPTYLYGFWDDESGMIGGTPEQLFQIDAAGILTTAAIAGTVRGKHEQMLLSDPKLKLEHDLVIEGMCESLAPFGAIEVGETEILHLEHLSHAKTPIRVRLNAIDQIEAIIRALHPTPALGAIPRNAGNRWLALYNKSLPRGRYGAPVGVKIGNLFYCYVAIRNIQWDRNETRLGVGGGVVECSNEKDEKDELALKFQATRSMLNI